MRVVVTGAHGFLGQHMLDFLKTRGDALDLFALKGKTTKGGVAGVTLIDTLVEADALIHLAGGGGIDESFDDPVGSFDQHASLAIETIDEAYRLGIGTVILASSCAVYGPADRALSEDQAPTPLSPYGVAKLAAENYSQYVKRKRGQDVRIARIANAYGPGQQRLVVYDLIRRALSQGEPLNVKGTGREKRDFVHARDVAAGFWSILTAGAAGGIYNLGFGEPTAIRDLARMIAEVCGLRISDVTFEGPEPPAGTVFDGYPDIAKLKRLGYAPRVTLDQGIYETVEWVRGIL